MGEVALRKLQGGVEATRGTAVAATKKLYTTQTITIEQHSRYAVEDRGVFDEKWRANPKLRDAGFSLVGDATFEDMPYFLDMALKGGVVSTGTALVGYTWVYVGDQTSDTLTTRTLEAGDDTVSWQAPFATIDTLDFTMALDDAVKFTATGFAQDWIPQTSTFRTTAYTGFTAALPDRVVESCMGWQAKLFIDPAGTTAGTTQVLGRFISATWGYHNQNKRKNFGDNNQLSLQKLGRGKRQVMADIVFEAADQAQFADFVLKNSKVVRIGLFGVGIAGTTGPVLKAQYYDFYGTWDTFAIANRDTNTTWSMHFDAIYDVGAAKTHQVTVINAQSAL